MTAQKSTAFGITGVVIDQEKGTVNAYGERFLFMPVGLIHSIEDRLTESFGPVTAISFQYEIGREGGAKFTKFARKIGFPIKSASDIQRMADSLGTMSGWGKIDVVEFDFKKRHARIRWKNGVSVRKRTGKTPVCHFGRGILTGAVAEILGAKCESIELSCQGKGDKYCEAVIAEPREINRLVDTTR